MSLEFFAQSANYAGCLIFKFDAWISMTNINLVICLFVVKEHSRLFTSYSVCVCINIISGIQITVVNVHSSLSL